MRASTEVDAARYLFFLSYQERIEVRETPHRNPVPRGREWIAWHG
jgi:hypothetical protein